MNIPLYQLNKIIEEQLPAPGSINFENCQTVIEVPIFKVTGMLSMGNEDDICGMEPGHAEVIKEQVGKLVFRKVGKDWELEVFSQEEVLYAIERTKLIVTDQINKKHEKEKQGQSVHVKEGKEVVKKRNQKGKNVKP